MTKKHIRYSIFFSLLIYAAVCFYYQFRAICYVPKRPDWQALPLRDRQPGEDLNAPYEQRQREIAVSDAEIAKVRSRKKSVDEMLFCPLRTIGICNLVPELCDPPLAII
jgi:hypothetical protein